MNRWFRREYFVEKNPDAVINKRGWITVKIKYLFKFLKFTVKGLIDISSVRSKRGVGLSCMS